MKYYYYLLIIASFSCKFDRKTLSKKECNANLDKVSEYIFNYEVYKDTLALDSALMLIDKSLIGGCSNKRIVSIMSINNIKLLTRKHLYDKAISFADSTEAIPFEKEIPYFKNFILNKLKASKFYYHNTNPEKTKAFIEQNYNMVLDFIEANDKEFENLYRLDDINKILSKTIHIVPYQYFYNKNMLFGRDSIFNELKYNVNENGYNSEYVELIKIALNHNYLYFDGIN